MLSSASSLLATPTKVSPRRKLGRALVRHDRVKPPERLGGLCDDRVAPGVRERVTLDHDVSRAREGLGQLLGALLARRVVDRDGRALLSGLPDDLGAWVLVLGTSQEAVEGDGGEEGYRKWRCGRRGGRMRRRHGGCRYAPRPREPATTRTRFPLIDGIVDEWANDGCAMCCYADCNLTRSGMNASRSEVGITGYRACLAVPDHKRFH